MNYRNVVLLEVPFFYKGENLSFTAISLRFAYNKECIFIIFFSFFPQWLLQHYALADFWSTQDKTEKNSISTADQLHIG